MLLVQDEDWRELKWKFHLCSQVEQLMETYTVKNILKDDLTLTDLRLECDSLLAQLLFDFCNKKYSRTEVDWIATHLDLYQVLGRQYPLTAQEFEVIFFHQLIIDYHDKGIAWEHNRTCLVFFLNWYKEVVEVTQDVGRGIRVIWNAEWVHTQLAKLDELRKPFPFCKGCNFNKEECGFWGGVCRHISEHVTESPPEIQKLPLQAYFKQLHNPCLLPKSKEDFLKLWAFLREMS